MMNTNVKGFKGNLNIKKKGVQIDWTPEMISEYLKCKEDIFYFIEHYFKIVTEDGLTSMILYDYQKETIKSMVENRFTMMLQSRQSGKTEAFRAFIIWYILFHDYKTIALVADKEKTANEILGKIKLSYQQLPIWLQLGIVDFNKGSIVLENESRVFASATSSSSLVGFTVHIIIIDEAAVISNWDDFYASVKPTISAGKETKLIMASCVVEDTYIFTPNGPQRIKDFIDYTKPESSNFAYEIEPYKVMGKTGINNGQYIMNSGFHPTKKIKLMHSEIECSLKHKLFCFKDGKYDWVKTKDISINDYIAIQYGQNIWGNDNSLTDIKLDYKKALNKFYFKDDIDENMAYFLGLYLAEGYTQNELSKSRTVISCGDDISYALEFLNLKYSCKDKMHYCISSKSLCDFIEAFGFNINLKAKNKIIPDRIMKMSPNLVAKFLSGFFDGDGHISKTKEVITVTSASEILIDQIRLLLLNFGILSIKTNGTNKPTKKVNCFSDFYKLEISSQHYYKFNEIIGFVLPRKKLCIKTRSQKRFGCPSDIIPDAFNLFEKNGINIPRSGHYKGKKDLSRQFCLTIKRNEELKNIISENIIWSKVKTIKESENKVYDFSLDHIGDDPWCHSVIYNGIIGHQTPRGLNHYYEFFQGSDLGEGKMKGTNGFKAFFIPWWRVPGRTEEWKQAELASMNYNYLKFDQEYNCSFIGSSGTLIAGDALKRLQQNTLEPIITLEENSLKIFEYPIKEIKEIKEGKDILIPQHMYALIADVSRGKGLDYSVFSVFDITSIPYRQVCTYRNNQISPTDYEDIIQRVGKIYNNANILVEINDIGEQIGTMLLEEHQYENVICSESAGRSGKKACYYTNKADKGIRTTAPVKNSGCLLLKLLIEQNKLEIADHETVNELTTFSKIKNSYQAEKGKHDDLVMTLVLFAWLSDQELFKEITDINTFGSFKEKTKEDLDNEFIPSFGIITPQDYLYNGESILKVNNLNIPFNPYYIGGYAPTATIVPNF